jgi:hypothetical protein
VGPVPLTIQGILRLRCDRCWLAHPLQTGVFVGARGEVRICLRCYSYLQSRAALAHFLDTFDPKEERTC